MGSVFEINCEMTVNNKIVKNSFFLYLRMFILLGMGFFTSRKFLEALGVSDLGIYNVVGSFVLMFDFISSGLTNSTQRFLNIGLGKNDIRLANQYFSQSLILHLFLGVMIALVIKVIGSIYLFDNLVIPQERLSAAIYVFHISIAILFLKFIRICFESNIIAREKMSAYAYLSIVEGFAKLIICYILLNCDSFDRLKVYGTLLLVVNFIIVGYYVFYCLFNFPESRFKIYKDVLVFKDLLSFVGVNSFGVISWALGKQGINVVMNIFLGPAVNGAKALASQLDRVVTQFGANIDLAVRPQIMKMYAQNDIDGMISMAMKATKYIYFVMLVVAAPILYLTDDVLKVWLGNVPDYTAVFVKILIFEEIFNVMGKPFNDVSMAIGKIKTIQVYGRLITLSVLPLSYIILKNNPNPVYPVVLLVFLTLLYTLFIVWNMNHYLRFGLKVYCEKVLFPIALTTLVTIVTNIFVLHIFSVENVLFSILLKTPLVLLISFIFVILLGLNCEERDFLKKMAMKKMNIGEN